MNLTKTPAKPLVDVKARQKMADELAAAIKGLDGWERRDVDTAVVAGRLDGEATIVGSDLGNWRLVLPGRIGQHIVQQVASAGDALAQAGKAKP